MTFPQPRFASLEFADRIRAIDNWQRAMECRDQARRYRRWGWTLDAQSAQRVAFIALDNVKYFARKAKANGN